MTFADLGDSPGGAGFSPMPLTLPKRWNSALIVGRTPWSARDALVPLLPNGIRHLRSLRSRPGGRLRRTRASAPGPTSGTVTVTESAPAGMTLRVDERYGVDVRGRQHLHAAGRIAARRQLSHHHGDPERGGQRAGLGDESGHCARRRVIARPLSATLRRSLRSSLPAMSATTPLLTLSMCS